MRDRHLVLDADWQAGTATIACQPEPAMFDRAQHTLLAALTTCPACKAVQAARKVLIYTDLNG